MAQVRLILREDVDNLGHAGDLVLVKPGFARNFLLPQGKATVATEARVKELEHHRRLIAEQQAKALKDLQAVKQRMEGTVVEIAATAGEGGRLFGSVTMQHVADALAQQGIQADRRKLSVDEPIKTLGEHRVALKLHRELSVEIKVNVVAGASAAGEELVEDALASDTSLTRDAAYAPESAADASPLDAEEDEDEARADAADEDDL